MPRLGFETTIPVFERAKMVHALDRATTVIDYDIQLTPKNYSTYSPNHPKLWLNFKHSYSILSPRINPLFEIWILYNFRYFLLSFLSIRLKTYLSHILPYVLPLLSKRHPTIQRYVTHTVEISAAKNPMGRSGSRAV
jgi:hypothetical protein